MTKDAKEVRKNKILKGLETAYEKMLDFKRQKNSEVVIISDVHLGTYGCHAKELISYLKTITKLESALCKIYLKVQLRKTM